MEGESIDPFDPPLDPPLIQYSSTQSGYSNVGTHVCLYISLESHSTHTQLLTSESEHRQVLTLENEEQQTSRNMNLQISKY